MSKNFLSNLSIQNVISANRMYTQKNISTTKKDRLYWGISIKIDGETKYNCKGEEIISNANNIVILPKGANYFWNSSGGECLLIDFDSETTADSIISFHVKDNSKIIELFNKIQTLLVVKPPHYNIKSLHLVYKLLVLLLESENKKYVPSHKTEKIAPAVDYMVQNYNDSNITGEFLSSLANVSYTYFRKIFTESYGCAPMEYLHMLRMKKAAEMLKTDYDSIDSISISVGYNSIYHFSKMFKKHFGISPSKYVAHHQKPGVNIPKM